MLAKAKGKPQLAALLSSLGALGGLGPSAAAAASGQPGGRNGVSSAASPRSSAQAGHALLPPRGGVASCGLGAEGSSPRLSWSSSSDGSSSGGSSSLVLAAASFDPDPMLMQVEGLRGRCERLQQSAVLQERHGDAVVAQVVRQLSPRGAVAAALAALDQAQAVSRLRGQQRR